MTSFILETIHELIALYWEANSLTYPIIAVAFTYIVPTTLVILAIMIITVSGIFFHLVETSTTDSDFARQLVKAEARMLRLDVAKLRIDLERMEARAEMLEERYALLESRRRREIGRRLG